MTSNDDFRFESHKFLLKIDAAVTELMKLVAYGRTLGPEWVEAQTRYEAAHSEWLLFLLRTPLDEHT